MASMVRLLFLSLGLLGWSCSQENSNTPQGPHGLERHLKLAATEDPLSLDPRLVRDLASSTTMRMLYEGLTRPDAQGVIQPALAEKINISEDQKNYTFTLRPSLWSDGTPLTAEDFEKTWKTILAKDFPAPNAYQLYLIKGAKDAKEGLIPMEQIGVKALSANTLLVELEQPNPYFLEMVSCHFYFPVHSTLREQSSTAQTKIQDNFVGNGPFSFDHVKQRNELSVVKNPHYWDVSAVKLDRITLQILDENTALQMFHEGSIEWAGSPLSTLPQDAIRSLKDKGNLQITLGAGTHWFRFNTLDQLFKSDKMRRAFALALNRQDIVDHVTQGNQLPAIGIVPPSLGIRNQDYFADHDTSKAKKLFQEALEELNMNHAQLPKISLTYVANDRSHKIAQAVQQQWNQAFDIKMHLDSTEAHVLFDKMHQGSFQISLGSWYADIQDPINFLEIFKSKENPTNQTNWQSDGYKTLLDTSSLEGDATKRLKILAEAEKTLITAMPVAPLFHSSYNYLKSDAVEGVYFSPLGFLDFKNAQIKQK